MPRCWDARERDKSARPNPGRRGSTVVSYSRALYREARTPFPTLWIPAFAGMTAEKSGTAAEKSGTAAEKSGTAGKNRRRWRDKRPVQSSVNAP